MIYFFALFLQQKNSRTVKLSLSDSVWQETEAVADTPEAASISDSVVRQNGWAGLVNNGWVWAECWEDGSSHIKYL